MRFISEIIHDTELLFRESEDIQGWVVGGTNVSNLRCVDDTALIAENDQDLQMIV